MIDNILPVTKIEKISYSKITLGEYKNSSKHQLIGDTILPYISNRFDSVLFSFYNTQLRNNFFTKFDDFRYENQYDSNEIYTSSYTKNYINSKLFKQQKQEIINVVKFTLELLFDPIFLDEDFWFNSVLRVPTKHYDKDSKKRIALEIKNSILENVSFSVESNKIVKCNVSLITTNINKSTYDYNVGIWRGFDVFGNWYNIEEYPIKSFSYSKTSTVNIKNKIEQVNYSNFQYVYDVYSDRLERYNPYITMNSKLYSVDSDINFMFIQTTYNESFSIDLIKDFETTNMFDDLEFIVNTRYNRFRIKLYPDDNNRKNDTTFSLSGKGVLEWL